MVRLALGLALAVALVLAGLAAAGPADIDTTFGTNGFASPGGGVTAIARDSAGRIVVVNNGGLTRLTPGGGTDPTFNGGSPVALSGFIGAVDVVVQSDDRIVVAGDDKASALALAMSAADRHEVPAAGVHGTQETRYLVDRAAASLLPDGMLD